jgi:hypothetical protein
MIRKFVLSAVGVAFLVVSALALPTVARADTASDIAAIIANGALTVEEIAIQVAELVTNAADPSAAAATILAATDGASADQLEGVGIGLGRAVLALAATDPAEATEVAAEVAAAPEAIQTAFTGETGQTAAILSSSGVASFLITDSGFQSAD